MRLVADGSGASLPEIQEIVSSLRTHIGDLSKIAENGGYESQASFVNLPADTTIVGKATDFLQTINTSGLKYLIICGIGGSNLGAKDLYDAIYGYYESLTPGRFPKMVFADTVDDQFISNLSATLITRLEDPADFLLFNISKSGKTLETQVNFEITHSLLAEKFGSEMVGKRTVFITNPDSPLSKIGQEKNIKTFEIPKKIGGRFSVFSNVGIVPLMAAGLNVTELINGASTARQAGVNRGISANPSLLSASVIYWTMRTGIGIHDSFFFTPSLESLGKWYRQLVGESLGKDDKGITPTVSIGSIDLHSMLQLYVGGPRDKFTSFIHIPQGHDVKVPDQLLLNSLGNNISGKSTGQIMEAIYGGVIRTYKEQNLPHMEIILDGPSIEYNIGEFMMFKMIEVYYLAMLLGVDPFTQPNVEGYKKETKLLLG